MNPLLGGPNEPLPDPGYERALGCQRAVNEQQLSCSEMSSVARLEESRAVSSGD